MYFVTVAAMPVSVKYGIDTIAACKPQYGTMGSAFGIIAQFASIVGWNCILIILFGRAAANVLAAGGVIGDGLGLPRVGDRLARDASPTSSTW